MRMSVAAICASGLLLGACGTDTATIAQYNGIGADETIYFSGNEPFWGGETTGETLRYTTPEHPDGSMFSVRRFAGNNGLGITGSLEGKSFDMVVTPGTCLDTMADRAYPYVVTLMLNKELREGCGWTERQPFTATTRD
ncbi:MAG: hypothetical protein WA954_11560 [Parerythrobacter sp.]